jgi:hypothetical protein
MTDQEKLQKLFDAALRDSSPVEKTPTRAVPKPLVAPQAEPETREIPVTASVPAKAASKPADAERALLSAEEIPTLDKAAAEELGILLDAQMLRQKRKRRRESLVMAVVLIGLTGGGSAWFVHSPQRVQAFLSVIAEIRSVGDIKAIVAKYEAALQRVKVRGEQIDQATTSMGVKITGDEKDQYFNAEMKAMMGGEGKTSGDRAAMLQKSFGKMKDKPGASLADSLGEMDLPGREQ